MVHTTLSEVTQIVQSGNIENFKHPGQRTGNSGNIENFKHPGQRTGNSGNIENFKHPGQRAENIGNIEIPSQRTGNIDIKACINNLGQRTRQQLEK